MSTGIQRVVVVGGGRAAGALLASLRVAGLSADQHSSRSDGIAIGADADVVVVAVSDQAIPAVAAALTVAGDPLVVHLAGSLGRGVLGQHRRRGVFHPLASLAGVAPIPIGSLCACDADTDDDAALLAALAHRLGLVPARVGDEARARYHAGAVLAGNLATALLQLGVDELVRVGIDADVARQSLARLLASTAARAEAAPLDVALTGPIARGDVDTVARHIAVLDDDVTRDVYRRLSRVLVERVRPAGAAVADWSLLDDGDDGDDDPAGSR